MMIFNCYFIVIAWNVLWASISEDVLFKWFEDNIYKEYFKSII